MRELSLHVLDLIQNSLEAGATTISLIVMEDITGDKLTIRVSDNGKGMNKTECRKAVDPFVTSRKTRTVGLGLPLIAMYTELCEGSLKLDSLPGVGTTVEAVFRYSHFDRPPLGNMVDTIKIIVIGNPDLNFTYRHIVQDRMFTLSTAELVRNLGMMPLCYPDVISWLDEYLTENLARLNGGAEK